MKKTAVFMLIALIVSSVFTGCGKVAKVDYDSPKALIEAHEAIHTEWENNRIYDDLQGKTFRVVTTQKLDKSEPLGDAEEAAKSDGYTWLCIPYSDINIDVFLELTNEQWEKIEYNKNDILVLKAGYISQRGTKNGKIRQYYITATLADEN